jgi:spore germination protein
LVPRLGRRFAAAIAIVAAVGTLAGCSASSAGFEVTGYAESGATTKTQVLASANAMTEVGVDGVNLTASGDGVSAPDAAALRLLAEAHTHHLRASLLFGNFSNAIGDFSDPLAEELFRSPTNIRDVVSALVHEVRRHHWDGITIDLESLNGFGASGHTRDDNAGLDKFVTALRAGLGSRSLSICLSATTGSYANLGYDLHTISTSVDHVVLMAYDQHGPAWSKAGPVGGYPWVKQSVRGLLKSVPAAKIQLGVGEYGYTWPAHAIGTNYSDASMRALVRQNGARAVWSSSQLEWYSTFADGETVWWSDARSYRARVALARALHLGGVAVWSLGQGDPLRNGTN